MRLILFRVLQTGTSAAWQESSEDDAGVTTGSGSDRAIVGQSASSPGVDPVATAPGTDHTLMQIILPARRRSAPQCARCFPAAQCLPGELPHHFALTFAPARKVSGRGR